MRDAPGTGRWSRIAAAAAVLAVTVLLVTLSVRGIRPEHGSIALVATDAAYPPWRRSPGTISGLLCRGVADVPVGLLCDYYEHGIEHAPPRDPSGVMQRRELRYRAPGDPADVVSRRAAAAQPWGQLKDLYREYIGQLSAESGSRTAIARLEHSLSESPISPVELLDVGRAVNWLGDSEDAARLYVVAINCALSDRQIFRPDSQEAQQLLARLDQTKALWDVKAYSALERRFHLAARLNPALSAESRRAKYLEADALYYQGFANAAATLITQVQAEHLQVGDLGQLERSDVPEMEWAQGLFLYHAGRFADAVPHLRAVSMPGSYRCPDIALRLEVASFIRLGRTVAARHRLIDYVRTYLPAADDVRPLVVALDNASARPDSMSVPEKGWY